MDADGLLDAIGRFIAGGEIPGAVVGVLREGQVSLAAAGTTSAGGAPVGVDALMRISSNTKPMAAALTVALAEDGVLALADPIERFVPELAGRRVLARLEGPVNDTVAAHRPVTVEDLLTMRLGFGFVFEADCPAAQAAAEAGLGMGPPDPSLPLSPDDWIRRFAELPLMEQPGTVWRYELAYAVLGVLLARAAKRPLPSLMRERLFEPLNMTDTGFVAERLPPCFVAGETGLAVFDDAGHGSRWAAAPTFPDARGGLVSTATDLLRFAGALLDGGAGVLSPAGVAAMTTDKLTADQRRGPSAQLFLDNGGWGYGVQVIDADRTAAGPRYGWGGGLGTLWYSWPDRRAAAVLLTQVLPPSAALVAAFVSAAERSLAAS